MFVKRKLISDLNSSPPACKKKGMREFQSLPAILGKETEITMCFLVRDERVS